MRLGGANWPFRPISRRHLPVRRIGGENVLQGPPGQRLAVMRNLVQAVDELLVDVVPAHMELGVAEPGPPLLLEVRPHALDRVQLRRGRRQEF